MEETIDNKVNENDYLLKLNRRAIKLSPTVFFFNVAKLVLLAHGRKHQNRTQGSFPLAPTEPLTYAAVLCVLNASVHKTTCG